MNFQFNAAQKLVTGDIRPRLYFGPDDIDSIRSGLDFPAGKRLWKNFKRRSRALTEMALNFEDLDEPLSKWCDRWDQPATKIVFGLADIAALAVLDDDSDALEVCRRVFAACPAAERLSKGGGRKRLGYMTGFWLAPAYDLVAGRLTPAERRTFCTWADQSVVRKTLDELDPRFFFGPGANIPIVGMCSAWITALSLLGDRQAPQDARILARLGTMLETAVGAAINPDGYPIEDIGYGTAIASDLAIGIECGRRLGVIDLDRSMPRYRRFGKAMLHFAQPWGEHLSNTGDHGDDFRERHFILPRLAQATGNPALLWLWQTLSYDHGMIHPANSDPVLYRETLVGRGRQTPATLASLLHAPLLNQARHPSALQLSTAFCDRRRGIVSFRSGWKADDTLLVFDGSQRSAGAQGHHHDSAGHFSLSALGEYFSIDTGRYNNAQSCHSVVLVKGTCDDGNGEWIQTKHEGRLYEYAPHPFVDTAAVDSTPQHHVRKAERRIGLVKGRGAPAYVWVVDNINAGNAIGWFDWQMQCAPESRVRTRRDGATVTGFRHGNLLDVHMALPLFPGNRKSPDAHRIQSVFSDLAYPSATKYLKFDDPATIRAAVAQFTRPAAMVHGPVYERPRLVIRFEGWNGRCLALLLPRRKGERAARITQLAALPGTIAVDIRFETVTDTLIVSFDHPMLQAGPVDRRGLWCVVRRRNRDGKIMDSATGEDAV